MLEANGALRHVPTEIVVIDGKNYAKINSITNSTYSVVFNPVTFAGVFEFNIRHENNPVPFISCWQ